jgi:hypothetical protein
MPIAAKLQHDDNNDSDNDINDNDDDDDEKEYTPLSDSDSENVKMYRDASVFQSFGNEAPVPTGRLRALLDYVGITTTQSTESRESRVQGKKSSGKSWRSSMGPT